MKWPALPSERTIPGRQSAGVASVSARATAGGDSSCMDQKSIGKARWARARAASLWQQADDLDRNHSGDWRARATRRRGADRLRAEASRFDGIANRLQPVDDDWAA